MRPGPRRRTPVQMSRPGTFTSISSIVITIMFSFFIIIASCTPLVHSLPIITTTTSNSISDTNFKSPSAQPGPGPGLRRHELEQHGIVVVARDSITSSSSLSSSSFCSFKTWDNSPEFRLFTTSLVLLVVGVHFGLCAGRVCIKKRRRARQANFKCSECQRRPR
ncbi:hypothetical protein ABEF92_004382 [Exophiala dermatitidis]|uniref:Transmembrane protein n=1 Tax=Exophiala dermatitidis (strain ATCC 34100 / CBS 525.76 / NIH/UT8656) TaxID=858893 RepID=H6BZT1_EXODN|nr:uncharacterized protein HMPREF1120_05184 [Exophiala dermatitidis NIH/UT8656]EHY57135.1 hypothetical protein HMPREF1120_05184 [Exophiala dermatitidis NIH/UT8656]